MGRFQESGRLCAERVGLNGHCKEEHVLRGSDEGMGVSISSHCICLEGCSDFGGRGGKRDESKLLLFNGASFC